MAVKADETAKRLMTIPGVGPVTASAIMATIQDIGDFASGREFAAFLGLTPCQSSTGGKSARAHHQDGRPLPAQAAGRRRLRVTLRHRKGIMMLCVCGRAGCSSARQSNTSSS